MQLERDSVQHLRRQARTVLNDVREKLRLKEEQLKPLREARYDVLKCMCSAKPCTCPVNEVFMTGTAIGMQHL